jgi:alcohol dehydrogenase
MMSKCPAAQCIVRDRYTFSDDLQQAVVEARRRALGEEPQFDARSLEEVVKYGWGIDYVMESYGGPYFEPSLNLINAGGNMATYGSTSYNREGGFRLPLWSIVWQYLTRPRIDPGELTTRNIRVGGFNLIFLTERIEELNAALDQCLLLNCVPLVGIAFDFDTQAVDALEALRSGQSIGKVVLSNTNNPMLPAR